MAVKVGINGFGRIGRNIVRAIAETGRSDIKVVAINDLAPVEYMVHMLEFDSIHGRINVPVTVNGNNIQLSDHEILATTERDPAQLPWSDVDIVLECTGIFTNREEAAKHLKNGSNKVLISAPAENADKTVVFGVNDYSLTSDDVIVSNASCTTNCLAPIAKILNQSVGIIRGFMTTVHAYTSDQPTLDAFHENLYRSRGAALSMIPTTTGAARAVGLVLPELKGKLDGVAIRVPVPNVSVVDLTFESATDTSVDEINEVMKEAAEGSMAGIVGYTDKPNVSIDFNHDNRSSIFHSDQTRVLDKRFCRVLSWYDNEWGFSNRMADVAVAMSKT